jgi:hypothetical protein
MDRLPNDTSPVTISAIIATTTSAWFLLSLSSSSSARCSLPPGLRARDDEVGELLAEVDEHIVLPIESFHSLPFRLPGKVAEDTPWGFRLIAQYLRP